MFKRKIKYYYKQQNPDRKIHCIGICLFFISVVVLLNSCESVIDFPDVPRAEPIPVIEAILTDRFEPQKVRVSQSVPINDSLACKIIENAVVYVYSDYDTLFYNYHDDGWYKSDSFAAKINSRYTLEVIIDSVVHRAEGSATQVNGIDSIYSVLNDTTYNVYIDYRKTGETIRYFYADIFRNSELLDKGTDMFIYYDENIRNKIKLKLPYTFNKNDTVIMDFYSLTKEMFDYYFKLYYSLYYTNYFNIGYKDNPESMFDKKAMGYFQVSSVYSEKLIIQ